MWDSHIRLGGGAFRLGLFDPLADISKAAGTNLEGSNCPSSGSGGTANCMAAFLGLHLTSASTAYLEVYYFHLFHFLANTPQGTWVWLADHELDQAGQGQVSLFSGRGILSESAGPGLCFLLNEPVLSRHTESCIVWMIGTASEHHVMYQYNLVNAQSHYLGLIQTETVSF
jgi:glucan 1,3-beta-glucosidase